MADLGICDAIKLSLTNVAPDQLDGNFFNEGGTLKALTDELNTRGQSPTPDKGDGMVSRKTSRSGNPVVEIRNYQRSTAATATTRDCTPSAAGTPVSTDFELTKFRQASVRLPLALMNELCGDAARVYSAAQTLPGGIQMSNIAANTPIMEEVRQILINQVFLPLVKDVNSDILTEIAASKVGVNVTTGDALPKALNLFDANGDLRQQGHTTLYTDFVQNAMTGTPIVIGSTPLLQYVTQLGWGCCNDAGVNFQEMAMNAPIRGYYDYNADTILGANELLAFAPEMLKFASFTENKFMAFQGMKHGTSQFGWVELLELPGIEWDLQIKEADCDTPSWDVFVRIYFDVWGAGSSIFAGGDRLAGVNGVFSYVSA